jgi:hypothetical protein
MLEALPAEVIEQIFLHSLNLNLPRASPFVSRALSRERIYRSLILLAFWDVPVDIPVSKFIDRTMMGPFEYVPISREDRKRLQKQVLRCKWLTAERVREQLPTMQILSLHLLGINDDIKVNEDQQDDFDKLIARQKDSPHVFHGEGPVNGRMASWILANYRDRIKPCPDILEGPHKYEFYIKPMFYMQVRCISEHPFAVYDLDILALTLDEFPDHLLRGRSDGFRLEDVALLEVLRMTSFNWYMGDPGASKDCGFNMPSSTTFNRKALNEGIHKAIRTQNYNAMVTLLKIDEFAFRFKDKNRMTDNTLYEIPEEHFFTVIRTGRDNPQLNAAFFEALLRASAESVPTQSSEMTEWIVDNMNLMKNQPNAEYEFNYKLAHWLADFQLRLPAHIKRLEQSGVCQLFSAGELNYELPEGIIYANEVLNPDREPQRNWHKESSFPVQEYWVKDSDPRPK